MKGAIVADADDRSADEGDVGAMPDLDIPEVPEVPDESTGWTPLEEASTEGGPGRRLGGLLALLLGVVGTLLALILAFLALRLLFGASGTVDDLMAPVETAVDRIEDRVDQTDELIDRRGIDQDQVGELRARVDGLVDLTTSADQSFDTVADHAVYGILPADLSGLGDALDGYVDSASAIDESLGSTPTPRPAAAAVMADEIDGMQSRITDARDAVDDAASSLRSWLRIGGLLGFLGALWLLWSQVVLARRGWRGFRNRPV